MHDDMASTIHRSLVIGDRHDREDDAEVGAIGFWGAAADAAAEVGP